MQFEIILDPTYTIMQRHSIFYILLLKVVNLGETLKSIWRPWLSVEILKVLILHKNPDNISVVVFSEDTAIPRYCT